MAHCTEPTMLIVIMLSAVVLNDESLSDPSRKQDLDYRDKDHPRHKKWRVGHLDNPHNDI
jgi:hypothetical protein